MSLKDVLAPAIQMADGYAIEAEITRTIERTKDEIKKWKYSPAIMLTHSGQAQLRHRVVTARGCCGHVAIRRTTSTGIRPSLAKILALRRSGIQSYR